MIPTVLAVYSGNSTGGSHDHAFQIVVGLVAIAIGLAHTINPLLGWRLSRWKYRNPEAMRPSDAALTVTRVGGVVAIVIGVVFLVLGLAG